MLDDAVAGFLDSVTERGLDEPLLAVLRLRGFTNLHLTHGGTEFGKDIIGQLDGEQWVFQSKKGDIGQSAFRRLTGQLDELRTNDLSHPDFRTDLRRRAVLVTTGRLVGNASLSAQDYSRRAREKGEPELEVWSRDELLGFFAGNPDAVLRGSIDGQLLGLLGAIDGGSVDMDSLERFSLRWTNMEPDRVASLGVVEAGLACERLRAMDRLDLACHLALCMVRGGCASESPEAQSLAADAGRALFDTYAAALWERCDEGFFESDQLLAYGAGLVSYPVRAMRLAELLSLFALRLRADDPERAKLVTQFVEALVRREPGTARPISDRFGVSLIPVVIELAREHAATAENALERATVWLCDRYEREELGLAAVDAPPSEETARLLGAPFESVSRPPRRSSQIAGILLDLAALLDLGRLYEDIRNDVQAVRVFPSVLLTTDGRDQFLREGESNRWDYGPDYAETLGDNQPVSPHLAEASSDRALVVAGRWWDLLAISAVLRDRHFVAAIRAVLERHRSCARQGVRARRNG